MLMVGREALCGFHETLGNDQGEKSEGEKHLEETAAGGWVHRSENLSAGVVVAVGLDLSGADHQI